MTRPFVTISPSSLDKWEACPRLWKVTTIDKKKDHGTAATYKGDEFHAAMERAAKDTTVTAPSAWAQDIINKLRARGGRLEPEKWLSVTRNMRNAPYGVTPWIRQKVDLVWVSLDNRQMSIIDWKSGNWVPSESQVDWGQLSMNALTAFGVYPELQEVKAAYAYTAKEKLFPIKFVRKDLEVGGGFDKIRRRLAAHEEGQKAEVFPYVPGHKCGYCPDTTCPAHPNHEDDTRE